MINNKSLLSLFAALFTMVAMTSSAFADPHQGYMGFKKPGEPQSGPPQGDCPPKQQPAGGTTTVIQNNTHTADHYYHTNTRTRVVVASDPQQLKLLKDIKHTVDDGFGQTKQAVHDEGDQTRQLFTTFGKPYVAGAATPVAGAVYVPSGAQSSFVSFMVMFLETIMVLALIGGLVWAFIAWNKRKPINNAHMRTYRENSNSPEVDEDYDVVVTRRRRYGADGRVQSLLEKEVAIRRGTRGVIQKQRNIPILPF